MKDLESIENYFNGSLKEKEKVLFEERLRHDPTLKEEVAYYIQLQQALKDELVLKRHREWQQSTQTPILSLKRIFSIAAFFFIILGSIWYWTLRPSMSLEDYATAYINEHLKERNILMSASQDSLQQAIILFNKGDLDACLDLSEQLVQRHPTNAEQLELAGITALRLHHYEKALGHFRNMEKLDLYDNPALFYQAVTLLKRKDSLDEQEAEKLLRKVLQDQLGGKKYAQEWLNLR